MRSFLYLHTDDLAAARHFYSSVLGLDESFVSDAVVGYQLGTLQLTIAFHERAARADGWARQLGWDGGDAAMPSWGIEMADEAFSPTIRRLQAAAAKGWNGQPSWVGYWSFPVVDPMGNTVEVSAVGEAAWPGS